MYYSNYFYKYSGPCFIFNSLSAAKSTLRLWVNSPHEKNYNGQLNVPKHPPAQYMYYSNYFYKYSGPCFIFNSLSAAKSTLRLWVNSPREKDYIGQLTVPKHPPRNICIILIIFTSIPGHVSYLIHFLQPSQL
jgi:hypothetical protein